MMHEAEKVSRVALAAALIAEAARLALVARGWLDGAELARARGLVGCGTVELLRAVVEVQRVEPAARLVVGPSGCREEDWGRSGPGD